MDTLFVIDIAMIVLLMVLANLSQRIGDALRIPKYYKIFYGSASIIVTVGFIDNVLISSNFSSSDSVQLITAMIRVIAITISIPVATRYWHWLLKEKLEN